jgi:hypothetical protein
MARVTRKIITFISLWLNCLAFKPVDLQDPCGILRIIIMVFDEAARQPRRNGMAKSEMYLPLSTLMMPGSAALSAARCTFNAVYASKPEKTGKRRSELKPERERSFSNQPTNPITAAWQ